MAIANPVNPRKKFAWTIEFDGLEPALAQKVKIPTLTIEEATHGAANLIIKTGGMVTVGDMEVNKLMFANKNENWAYEWFKQVSNHELGSMGVPSQYKRSGYIIFWQPNLTSILEKYQIIGAWPKEIEKDEMERTSSENVMEKVVFAVDSILRIPS